MAVKGQNKSRSFKKASKNKLKIPRWGIVVVIGLVAAIGIFAIWRSFAATGLLPNTTTKVVLNGGYGGEANVDNMNVNKKSPIEVVACRMSDILDDGPQNRIYVGAKPIITKELASKLNAVWDKDFPQYHIDGQDVPWAADYSMPKNVSFNASYVVDNNNRTDTTLSYGQVNNPSEIFKKLPKGGWWSGESYFTQYDQGKFPPALQRIGRGVDYGANKNQYPQNQYNVDPNPNISAGWVEAMFRGSSLLTKAIYTDKANNINELLSYNKSVTQNVGRQATYQDNIDLAKQVPIYFLRPGTLPGRTTWTYMGGKVMIYNQDKCPTRDGACVEDPNSYDIINNPNPLIRVSAQWNTNQIPRQTTNGNAPIVESVEKAVRFKDLPKCGQAPITSTKAQIDEFNKIKAKVTQQMSKATNERIAAGVNATAWTIPTKGPEAWKASDIDVKNGLSPLVFNGFWNITNEPAKIWPVVEPGNLKPR
ncbi:MAG TPA: hypothetical protein PKC05_04235 [Candidatus Saccharibacteria bacterium]|nr:hypothetical protein [Candidatus Saccharibacteria bacterium]